MKPRTTQRESPDYGIPLEEARDNVSKLGARNIYVISGDKSVRDTIAGHFDALGYPRENVKITANSSDLISKIKFYPDKVDMVICHMRTVDNNVSTQTGMRLLRVIKDMLLNAMYVRTIPVVFMEKEFTKLDIIESLKAGASQLMILPATPVILATKIIAGFGKTAKPVSSPEVYNLVLRGNKFRDMGRYEEAIICYNKALVIGGETVDILGEKASALLQMGDVEGAIKIYQRMIQLEANFPRAYQGLGEVHTQLGNFEEAKKNFKKVIEFEPDNVQVYHSLGRLHQEEGDHSTARSYFEKGIKINHKFAKNHIDLARNYELLGNTKEALKVFQDAIKQNPTESLLHITAGNFCLEHNFNTEAERIFEDALSLNKNHLHLYNRIGLALRRLGKHEKAILFYSKAIEIDASDPNIRYNLAKAQCMNNDEASAIENILVAFRLDPGLKTAIKSDEVFSKILGKYPEKFKDLTHS